MGIFSTLKMVGTINKVVDAVNKNKAKTAGDILELIYKLTEGIDYLEGVLNKAKTALAKLTERLEKLK